jgi:putative heme-binding domain-containing protein
MKKLASILAALACLGSFVALVANAPPLLLPWIVWFLAACAAAAWLWPGGRTVVFVLVMLGLFVFIGALITDISGGTEAVVAAAGVNPEAGESIYWGKGKCGTCHSLGDRGSAVRGPNHANICAVAEAERVALRQAAGATGIQTATDYLVESIADPDAHLTEGYSAAMPKVYLPPISLTPDEITAVILYLQAQGCQPDPSAIRLPPEVIAAAASAEEGGGEPFSLMVQGDPAAGRALFFDADSPAACGKCHVVAGEGSAVGPELTDVAATQSLAYIYESIMAPSASIAGGYDPILVQLADGTRLSGVIAAEDDASLTIRDKDGVETAVEKANIQRERRHPDEPSIMPANFSDLLTVKQTADLIAFLQESSGALPAE